MRTPAALAAVALASSTLLATAGLVWDREVGRDWAELVARVDAVEGEIRGRDPQRPVLAGPARDDEAFVHDLRAIELASVDEDLARLGRNLIWAQRASAEERAPFAADAPRIAPILAELALGASASRAEPPIDWSASEGEPGPSVGAHVVDWLPAERLVRIACAAASNELVEGRSARALEILLDGLQFARDLADLPLVDESGTGADLLVRYWLIGFGERGAWSMFLDEELERWVAALALVDEDLETIHAAIRVDLALFVRGVEADLARSAPAHPLHSTLVRRRTLRTHELLSAFEQEFVAAFEVEPQRLPGRIRARYEREGEPQGHRVSARLEDYGSATTQRVRGLAHLRLLRHALGRRLGHADLPATDRLGLPIRVETADGCERTFLDTGCPDSFSRLEVRIPVE